MAEFLVGLITGAVVTGLIAIGYYTPKLDGLKKLAEDAIKSGVEKVKEKL